LEKSRLLSLDKEQTVFYSGDHFDGIYAVLDGSIRLSNSNSEGREAVVAFASPIMWFGEISLVDQQPRSHDAITVQKSLVLHVHAKDLEQLLITHPQFWFHIAQLTSQKLRVAFSELIAIQTYKLSQRLAQRLVFILNGYGNHIEIENNIIRLSQEQLAQMLICSRQTINQELQKFEKLGILKISFKEIEILSVYQLNNIALQIDEL